MWTKHTKLGVSTQNQTTTSTTHVIMHVSHVWVYIECNHTKNNTKSFQHLSISVIHSINK